MSARGEVARPPRPREIEDAIFEKYVKVLEPGQWNVDGIDGYDFAGLRLEDLLRAASGSAETGGTGEKASEVRGLKILDLGCGGGAYLKQILDTELRVRNYAGVTGEAVPLWKGGDGVDVEYTTDSESGRLAVASAESKATWLAFDAASFSVSSGGLLDDRYAAAQAQARKDYASAFLRYEECDGVSFDRRKRVESRSRMDLVEDGDDLPRDVLEFSGSNQNYIVHAAPIEQLGRGWPVPEAWRNRFDIVLVSWTLLHLVDPLGFLRVVVEDLLSDRGFVVGNQFFLSMNGTNSVSGFYEEFLRTVLANAEKATEGAEQSLDAEISRARVLAQYRGGNFKGIALEHDSVLLTRRSLAASLRFDPTAARIPGLDFPPAEKLKALLAGEDAEVPPCDHGEVGSVRTESLWSGIDYASCLAEHGSQAVAKRGADYFDYLQTLAEHDEHGFERTSEHDEDDREWSCLGDGGEISEGAPQAGTGGIIAESSVDAENGWKGLLLHAVAEPWPGIEYSSQPVQSSFHGATWGQRQHATASYRIAGRSGGRTSDGVTRRQHQGVDYLRETPVVPSFAYAMRAALNAALEGSRRGDPAGRAAGSSRRGPGSSRREKPLVKKSAARSKWQTASTKMTTVNRFAQAGSGLAAARGLFARGQGAAATGSSDGTPTTTPEKKAQFTGPAGPPKDSELIYRGCIPGDIFRACKQSPQRVWTAQSCPSRGLQGAIYGAVWVGDTDGADVKTVGGSSADGGGGGGGGDSYTGSTLAMSEASTLPARVGSDDAQDASSATAEDASPYASPQLWFTAQMLLDAVEMRLRDECVELEKTFRRNPDVGKFVARAVRVLDVGRCDAEEDFVDEIRGFQSGSDVKHKRKYHRMEHRKVVKTLPDRTAPAVVTGGAGNLRGSMSHWRCGNLETAGDMFGHPSDFRDPFPEKSFDIVMSFGELFSDSSSGVTDPLGTLVRLYSEALAPGGVLLVKGLKIRVDEGTKAMVDREIREKFGPHEDFASGGADGETPPTSPTSGVTKKRGPGSRVYGLDRLDAGVAVLFAFAEILAWQGVECNVVADSLDPERRRVHWLMRKPPDRELAEVDRGPEPGDGGVGGGAEGEGMPSRVQSWVRVPVANLTLFPALRYRGVGVFSKSSDGGGGGSSEAVYGLSESHSSHLGSVVSNFASRIMALPAEGGGGPCGDVFCVPQGASATARFFAVPSTGVRTGDLHADKMPEAEKRKLEMTVGAFSGKNANSLLSRLLKPPAQLEVLYEKLGCKLLTFPLATSTGRPDWKRCLEKMS